MAKTKSKKNTSSKLVGLSLVNVDIEIDSASEDEVLEFGYSAEITVPKRLENELIFFRAEFAVNAKREGTEEKVRAISATYFCAVRCDPDYSEDIGLLARKYAETSVWGTFTTLFAVLCQQMGATFPILPPSSAGIKIVTEPDPESEDSAELGSSD